MIPKWGCVVTVAWRLRYWRIEGEGRIIVAVDGSYLRVLRSILFLTTIVAVFTGCPYGPFSSQDNPYERSVPVIPNDTLYADDQWYLDSVNAPRAWSVLAERTLEPSILAVIDKQPYGLHEDLAGVYTQDGADFVGGGASPLAFPAAGEITPVNDDHGNHVTGLAAAIADNNTGIAGVSYNRGGDINVRIMPIAMLDDSGFGTVGDLVAAMLYAAGLENGRGIGPAQRADVISMSLGARSLNPTEYALMASVVAAIDDAGVVMVAAAGNGDSGGTPDGVDYPAAFDEVIAVGSVTAALERSSFSDYGPELDIVAPGSSLVSTIGSDEYGALSGTSMATPLVSAAIALQRALIPPLSVNTIRELLRSTAIDLGPVGFDPYYGHGLLDIHGMLAASLVINPYSDLSASRTAPGRVSLTDRIDRIVGDTAVVPEELPVIDGSILLVLFDPEVTGGWEDPAMELERLAAPAGVRWRISVPTGTAITIPLVAEAIVLDGNDRRDAALLLAADPAVHLVTGNRSVIR